MDSQISRNLILSHFISVQWISTSFRFGKNLDSLQKHARDFDIIKRYVELVAFYKKLEGFETDFEWIIERLQYLKLQLKTVVKKEATAENSLIDFEEAKTNSKDLLVFEEFPRKEPLKRGITHEPSELEFKRGGP